SKPTPRHRAPDLWSVPSSRPAFSNRLRHGPTDVASDFADCKRPQDNVYVGMEVLGLTIGGGRTMAQITERPLIKSIRPVASENLVGDLIQPGHPLFGLVWINRDRLS